MAALGMRKQAPTEAAHCDDFHRHQEPRGETATHDRVSPVGGDSAPWRALRVLVVGAERDATQTLVALTRRSGHAAGVAYDGLAAFRVVANQHPDVVLLDLELPLLDGRRVARQLRLAFPRTDCLIIAVADWVDDERRRQCSQAGIDVVLVKPVETSVLETLLLLECELVNRPRTDKAASRAAKGSSPFARTTPSAH